MPRRVYRHAVEQPHDKSIRLIPLTRGLNATVDAADYESVSQFNWSAHRVKHTATETYYAQTHINGKSVQLQRFLCPEIPRIDHADRDGLNNRRINLRPCSSSQNRANSIAAHAKRFKGITYYKGWNLWRARIGINGKYLYLGSDKDPNVAAKLYDAAAIEHFGEFAKTNFPRPDSPATSLTTESIIGKDYLWESRPRVRVAPAHGRNSYSRKRCRCEICCAASRSYLQNYLRNKRGEAYRPLGPRLEPNCGTRSKYLKGCRCSLCVSAFKEYNRDYLIRKNLGLTKRKTKVSC